MAYSDGSAQFGDVPVSAGTERTSARAQELQARQLYPAILPAGFVYGVMEHVVGGWQMDSMQSSTPQAARDGLGWWFRVLARTRSTQEQAREEYWAASALLETERLNTLTAAGREFRIVRADQSYRYSQLAGPEPPRPGDYGPEPAKEKYRPAEKMTGGLLGRPQQPGSPELLGERWEFIPQGPMVPPDVTRDAVHALTAYPDIVVLPTRFAWAEQGDRALWWPLHGTSRSPREAQRSLAAWLGYHRQTAPADTAPADLAAYQQAETRLETEHVTRLTVAGRRYRIIRVQTVVRTGPDGPEPARPSDHDPEPPMTGETEALRGMGLIDDDT